MKTSKDIAEEIILYLRFQDRNNLIIDEALNQLFLAYEQAKKKEKEQQVR